MEILIAYICGACLWQLAEYFIHCYLGHVVKFNNLFKKEHDLHHQKTDYFSPFYLKILSAVPVSLVVFFTMSLIFPKEVSIYFTAGFITFYFVYELIHLSLHVVPPYTFYGKFIRKHHFYHHFINPKMNHGVTTPLFDIIFGTYEKVGHLKVPKNFAMKWLVSDDHLVKEKYQGDYFI
ncbi:MAG: hypothetical protein HOJ35_00075 [Bdellovibrionales bacterium]|jgi:sterol desaturase/sphingolipid hydroxylase (fatty acid hydroxylase superfamily)|nr:hypothetical protein [Bdellovibrionales bacterium]